MSAPSPIAPHFDEGLTRRLDTLFTAIGSLLLLGVEVVNVALGERVRALGSIELVALGLLIFPVLWRYRRMPAVAVAVTMLLLAVALRSSWFTTKIPELLFPLAHGLLACAFVLRARLPRAVIAALTTTSVGLTALCLLDLGVPGQSDFHMAATLSPIWLWATITVASRPKVDPEEHDSRPRWRAGSRRWWLYYRISLVLGGLLSCYWALADALSLLAAPILQFVGLFAGLTTLITLGALFSLFKSIEDLRCSTFWSGLRINTWIHLVGTVVLIGLHVYDIIWGHARWLPYLLTVGNLFSLVSKRVFTISATYVLRPSSTGRRKGRSWAWLVIAHQVLISTTSVIVWGLDLDRAHPFSATVLGLISLLGVVVTWGLLRVLHREIQEASMVEAFSSDFVPVETTRS